MLWAARITNDMELFELKMEKALISVKKHRVFNAVDSGFETRTKNSFRRDLQDFTVFNATL